MSYPLMYIGRTVDVNRLHVRLRSEEYAGGRSGRVWDYVVLDEGAPPASLPCCVSCLTSPILL